MSSEESSPTDQDRGAGSEGDSGARSSSNLPLKIEHVNAGPDSQGQNFEGATTAEQDGDDKEEDTAEEERNLELLRQSVLEMSFNRIDGRDDLYVGGIWALRRPKALDEKKITHILSVVNFKPTEISSDGGVRGGAKASTWEQYGKKYKHMIIDIDDMDDEDLLIHLPKAVRFIDEGLYPRDQSESAKKESAPPSNEAASEAAALPAEDSNVGPNAVEDPDIPKFAKLKLRPASSRRDNASPGAVYVHCAMGKSRSVSVVVAYLLWKYPHRFGRASARAGSEPDGPDGIDGLDGLDGVSSAESDAGPDIKKRAARLAVTAAIKWVQNSRPIADPNWGFRSQLQLWWEMGCPEDVEAHPTYRKWAYLREVERSVECGMAPTTLRFEDEEPQLKEKQVSVEAKGSGTVKGSARELKCRKCRRALATESFIIRVNHDSLERDPSTGQDVPCQHYFIEPLSWMRSTLEEEKLDGRLTCPNDKCGASVGRYSWKGFKCSCGEWITPAFSLQKSRVDEAVAHSPGASTHAASTRSMGIRMPPGANL